MSSAPPNRLARESSPYLLQHARNPVDWFPWGDEAFSRARDEDKPVFLSIGYSTCHWCHVMERESFENDAVAAVLNEHFVAVKVDREERPDVDKIYMTAVQLMGLGGGWPLSVWLTPDLKPFYGGTYFPPESRGGRMGFRDLLLRIADLWRTQRDKLDASAGELTRHLAAQTHPERAGAQSLTPALLDRAARAFMGEYDPQWGGFGGAPKFPRPSTPRFLLRHARRAGDTRARDMVFHTLVRMTDGGLYDQLGGGFSRYSVDEQWLVPHFEKMLYDQAQMVHLLLDAVQTGGAPPRLAEVARETCDYVLRDLTEPGGAFYCAEDADSEGREGAFYVWSPDQVHAVLPPDEAAVALRFLGITEAGNFSDHSAPGPQPPSQNVLSRTRSLAEVARELAVPPASVEARWEAARRKLFEARLQRPRPHRDSKVLTSWNGLMIGAMARTGAVLDEPRLTEAAARAAERLRTSLHDDATGRLRHSLGPERPDEPCLLDDYAFLLEGLLELHHATLDHAWLAWADDLAAAMIDRFADTEHGGFFQTTSGAGHLLVRVKEDYDGAEPSGNSVAALALLQLHARLDRPRYRDAAQGVLDWLAPRLASLPHALPHLCLALDEFLTPPLRLMITGPADAPERRALLREVRTRHLPHLALLGDNTPAPPALQGRPPGDGRAAAHLCHGETCRLPVHRADELAKLLDEVTS